MNAPSPSPFFASLSEANDRYPDRSRPGAFENHDRCAAGAVRLADGTTAWYAVVADGCGGNAFGTEVAERCVARFREAVASATAADLLHTAPLRAWTSRWGDALGREVAPLGARGGNSTLVGVVALPDPDVPGEMVFASVNVGDSVAFLYYGPSLSVLSLVPNAPMENRNTHDNGGLVRAVGRPALFGFPLLDCDLVRFDAGALPCLVCVASDGGYGAIGRPFLAAYEYRQLFAAGLHFDRLPRAILARNRAAARRRGMSTMDNASVAMLGFGLPASGIVAIRATGPAGGRAPAKPASHTPVRPWYRDLGVAAPLAAALVLLATLAIAFRPEGGKKKLDTIGVVTNSVGNLPVATNAPSADSHSGPAVEEAPAADTPRQEGETSEEGGTPALPENTAPAVSEAPTDPQPAESQEPLVVEPGAEKAEEAAAPAAGGPSALPEDAAPAVSEAPTDSKPDESQEPLVVEPDAEKTEQDAGPAAGGTPALPEDDAPAVSEAPTDSKPDESQEPLVIEPGAEKTEEDAGPAAGGPPVPPEAEFYTVGKGDNLTGIAEKFGRDPADLIAWNSDRYPGLKDQPDHIEVGWKLRVAPPPTTGD